jgi:hypothetical protein
MLQNSINQQKEVKSAAIFVASMERHISGYGVSMVSSDKDMVVEGNIDR